MKIKQVFNLDELSGNIYFISDLHLGHENVLKLDQRPFDRIDLMNQYILDELKNKLKPEDILIDLGDTFWRYPEKDCCDFIKEIPANTKIHIMGNHDKYPLYYHLHSKLRQEFTMVCDILDIVVKKDKNLYQLALSHYPLLEWNGQYRGAFMIHGHTHGHMDELNNNSIHLRVDVGFSSTLAKKLGTFIISFDDILNYFTEKTKGTSFVEWSKQYKCGSLT